MRKHKKYVVVYFKGHNLSMPLDHYEQVWRPSHESKGFRDQLDFWRLI